MENKEISAAELFVKAEQGIESLRDEAIYNHNKLVVNIDKNRDLTNKNFTSLNDSVLILDKRMNNLENVVKVAVVVTVFCHIWKKMKKKKQSGSDKNQAENGQK